MKLFQRITLALMGCMLLSTPAMAADYSFETKAPADYYGRRWIRVWREQRRIY